MDSAIANLPLLTKFILLFKDAIAITERNLFGKIQEVGG